MRDLNESLKLGELNWDPENRWNFFLEFKISYKVFDVSDYVFNFYFQDLEEQFARQISEWEQFFAEQDIPVTPSSSKRLSNFYRITWRG